MNLHEYQRFVTALTSIESSNLIALVKRLEDLEESEPNTNIPMLLTSAVGLAAESGEFMEPVKKCIFQSKPLDADTKFHMKRELGDIVFYLTMACTALDLNIQDIIDENVIKLKSRYPGGKFDADFSENRKDGDI